MGFKVLSLDGGGYRGYLTALMLVELQKAIDKACMDKSIPAKSILDCFDLIAGTSTGSLIAAALSIGKTPVEILDIFRVDGAMIFPAQSLIDIIFKAASSPLFDGRELEAVLDRVFGQTRLGDLRVALLITAFDSWNNRPLVFRSYDPACSRIRIYDACRGSSAYPAGFPSHVLKVNQDTNPYFQSLQEMKSYFSFDFSCDGSDGIPLVDGGIAANNPAGVALADTIGNASLRPWLSCRSPKCLDEGQESLLVSFGTGQLPFNINYEKARRFSVKDWNANLGNPLLEMMFIGYTKISDEFCRIVLGEKNFMRFQPILLQETIDSVLVAKNNVVRVTSEEAKIFAGSTFQATDAINRLFNRICEEYFYSNNYDSDSGSPERNLRLLADRITLP